jgi:hypothetical protein
MQLLAQSFKLMRYEENYSILKDSVETFYNRIKYIPLSQSGSVYLSFGGEVRQNQTITSMKIGEQVALAGTFFCFNAIIFMPICIWATGFAFSGNCAVVWKMGAGMGPARLMKIS